MPWIHLDSRQRNPNTTTQEGLFNLYTPVRVRKVRLHSFVCYNSFNNVTKETPAFRKSDGTEFKAEPGFYTPQQFINHLTNAGFTGITFDEDRFLLRYDIPYTIVGPHPVLGLENKKYTGQFTSLLQLSNPEVLSIDCMNLSTIGNTIAEHPSGRTFRPAIGFVPVTVGLGSQLVHIEPQKNWQRVETVVTNLHIAVTDSLTGRPIEHMSDYTLILEYE